MHQFGQRGGHAVLAQGFAFGGKSRMLHLPQAVMTRRIGLRPWGDRESGITLSTAG